LVNINNSSYPRRRSHCETPLSLGLLYFPSAHSKLVGFYGQHMGAAGKKVNLNLKEFQNDFRFREADVHLQKN
jgi:hypothetical protein